MDYDTWKTTDETWTLDPETGRPWSSAAEMPVRKGRWFLVRRLRGGEVRNGWAQKVVINPNSPDFSVRFTLVLAANAWNEPTAFYGSGEQMRAAGVISRRDDKLDRIYVDQLPIPFPSERAKL